MAGRDASHIASALCVRPHAPGWSAAGGTSESMSRIARMFLVAALFAALISGSGIAEPAPWVPQALLALFTALFVIAFLFSPRTYASVGRRTT